MTDDCRVAALHEAPILQSRPRSSIPTRVLNSPRICSSRCRSERGHHLQGRRRPSDRQCSLSDCCVRPNTTTSDGGSPRATTPCKTGSRRSSITNAWTGRTVRLTTPRPTRFTINQGFSSQPPKPLPPTHSTVENANWISEGWGPFQFARLSTLSRRRLWGSQPKRHSAMSPVLYVFHIRLGVRDGSSSRVRL